MTETNLTDHDSINARESISLDDSVQNSPADRAAAGPSGQNPIPVITDQRPAQPAGLCPLTQTQQQVEASLDRLLADFPEDTSAAEANAAVELKLRPQPELMRALALIARPGSAQPLRTEMVRKLILLRLLVDTHLLNLTSSTSIEPASLRTVFRSITTLIELVSALRHEFGTQSLELQHRDAQQFNGLLRALMPATDRLHSYGLLASMLEPMARAACDGRIHQVTQLKKQEAALFAAAVQPGHESGPAGRVVLDALALRCGMQRDLESWSALPEPEVAATDTPGEETLAAEPEPRLEGRHQELLERLHLDMAIYNVLLERIQYQQSATLAQGDKAAFDKISAAQRILFSVYSQVAGVVRQPVPEQTQREQNVDSALDNLFEEAMEAESEGEAVQSEEEVYLEALTEMRDSQREQPAATISAGVEPRKLRLRRRLLVASTLVLAVVAAAVNFVLYKAPATSPGPGLETFAPAMPLGMATPLGPAMYAEIPAFNWNAMSVAEREKRVALLGRLAQDKGFDVVLLVDESKTGLARWSRADGVILAPAAAIPAD